MTSVEWKWKPDILINVDSFEMIHNFFKKLGLGWKKLWTQKCVAPIYWLWIHPIIVFVFSYIAKILTIIIIISELFGQVFWLVNNCVSCAKTTAHIDLLIKWNGTKFQEAIQYWVINNFRCCLPTAFLKNKIQLYIYYLQWHVATSKAAL